MALFKKEWEMRPFVRWLLALILATLAFSVARPVSASLSPDDEPFYRCQVGGMSCHLDWDGDGRLSSPVDLIEQMGQETGTVEVRFNGLATVRLTTGDGMVSLDDALPIRLTAGSVVSASEINVAYNRGDTADFFVEVWFVGPRLDPTARVDPLPESVPYAGQDPAAVPNVYFPQTGHNLGGAFFAYWTANGQLERFGYPISEEVQQRLEDGRVYTVQYFERARMEWHPENPSGQQIELGQFGRLFHPADPAVAPVPGAMYFAKTGHNLSGSFLDKWLLGGGLAQFGYPISEPFSQRLEDGKVYTVQYFERARFEYHPENAAPYNVLLGQFGRAVARQARNPTLPVPH